MLLRRILLCSWGECRHALREDAGVLLRRMQACSWGGCRHALGEDAGFLFVKGAMFKMCLLSFFSCIIRRGYYYLIQGCWGLPYEEGIKTSYCLSR